MYQKIKQTIFQLIEPSKGNLTSKIFDVIIISLIILNIILVIAETFDVSDTARAVMNGVEVVSVIVFTIEYLLRVWTADMLYPQYRGVKARLKYIFSFMALIDLIAILPFYLPLIIPIDLRVLRILRVIRLLRIFKINRYTHALGLIAQVFRNKAAQLISSMFVVGLLIIIASVLMYNIESTVQPDAFSNALETMWWAVATLTTVGYGDVYPITAAGKILATIIAFLGIGMVAVPTGIITAGFTEIINKEKEDEKEDIHYCPHCGHKLDK
jgi:voltage-gated potassium channel